MIDRNRALLAWYRSERRDLPWRQNTDPYRILVSEVMLQQTQVARVIGYFTRFLDAFPTVEDLAAATMTEVLPLWSGLGYNSRARRLRDAARVVAQDGWPRDVDGLRTLPGVGPYTAAAVASICFGETVPAIDTNLRRVLSRWHGTAIDGSELSEYATSTIGEPAGEWNQAVMDLGSRLCRPTAPACDECPVSDWCTDPEVYQPPRRQSVFEGSRRQARAAVVRAITANGPMSLENVAITTGLSSERLDAAVASLEADASIVAAGEVVRIRS